MKGNFYLMEKYDIFVCYRGDSTLSCELGARIFERIKKYKVFFAPECISKGTNFKSIIPEIMKDISIVIILMDESFFSKINDIDDIVFYELQCALSNENIIFLPITMGKIDIKYDSTENIFGVSSCDRIKHISSIQYNGIYHFSIENDLLPYIDGIYDGGNLIKYMKKRDRNRYHSANDPKERDFLNLQQRLLYYFDNSVYEKHLLGKHNLSVLDVGCNNASQTMLRFGNDSRINVLFGIDRDKNCIEEACSKYPQGIFEVIDIDSNDFRSQMRKLMIKHKIDKFDFINISMVLLHLEYPARLLQVLKSFLVDNGVIFIRDIDDGLNFTYPDENSIFERLTNICKYCDMLGYRQSGRQIYTYLKNAEYRNIVLEKSGLNTSTLSIDEKDALFNIYFGYIPIALRKTIERLPTLRAKHDYGWVKNIMDAAYDSFMNSSTLFSIGYMIFTACK